MLHHILGRARRWRAGCVAGHVWTDRACPPACTRCGTTCRDDFSMLVHAR